MNAKKLKNLSKKKDKERKGNETAALLQNYNKSEFNADYLLISRLQSYDSYLREWRNISMYGKLKYSQM